MFKGAIVIVANIASVMAEPGTVLHAPLAAAPVAPPAHVITATSSSQVIARNHNGPLPNLPHPWLRHSIMLHQQQFSCELSTELCQNRKLPSYTH